MDIEALAAMLVKDNIKPAYNLKKGEIFKYFTATGDLPSFEIIQDTPEILVGFRFSSSKKGNPLAGPKALVTYVRKT